MKSKRYIWHPATVFFLLACLVVFLSWISEVYGMNIVRSETGEVIRVRSLLSPEGLRWLLRHVVENYVEFRALGPVLLVVAGVSVCLHSGWADACMRKWGWSYCHRTSECRQLSRKERRALQNSILVGIVYWIIVLFATFSPWAVLRGIDGGLVRSPFVDGFSFLCEWDVVPVSIHGSLSGRLLFRLSDVRLLGLFSFGYLYQRMDTGQLGVARTADCVLFDTIYPLIGCLLVLFQQGQTMNFMFSLKFYSYFFAVSTKRTTFAPQLRLVP